MVKWLEFLNWVAVLPYAYLVYFLGVFVGDSAKTAQAAAVLFWGYLAVFPLAVVVSGLVMRRARRTGRPFRAFVWWLLPWGLLAGMVWAFFPFVGFLSNRF